jgi:hypothetical protein
MTHCPACGHDQAAENRFCPACGTRLEESGVPGLRQAKLPALGSAATPPPEPERSVSRTLGLPFLLLLALAVLVLGGVAIAGTHAPVAAVPLATATPTRVAAATVTAAPTATATPLATATSTTAPTASATPIPTATATPRPTATPFPTATPVPYQTEQFRVSPHGDESMTYTIQRPPARFEGYILILGGNNDVGIRLRAPSGGYLIQQSRVAGRYAFDVRLPDAGPYTLFLDNSFSLITAKDVTMYSRVVEAQAGP